MVRDSLCSQRAVTFFWRGCSTKDHLDRVLDDCMDALVGPIAGDISSVIELAPGQEQYAKSKIKSRLKQAEAGKLRYPKAVETLKPRPGINLYELRWDKLGGTKRNRASGLPSPGVETVRLRVYYVEQPTDGDWALGLHAHRKDLIMKADSPGEVDQEATRNVQNGHIDTALTTLRDGATTWCGVPELQAILSPEPLAFIEEV